MEKRTGETGKMRNDFEKKPFLNPTQPNPTQPNPTQLKETEQW